MFFKTIKTLLLSHCRCIYWYTCVVSRRMGGNGGCLIMYSSSHRRELKFFYSYFSQRNISFFDISMCETNFLESSHFVTLGDRHDMTNKLIRLCYMCWIGMIKLTLWCIALHGLEPRRFAWRGQLVLVWHPTNRVMVARTW